MDVHKLERRVLSNRYFRTKTAARLVFFDRDVIVAVFFDRQTAENRVAVFAAVNQTVMAVAIFHAEIGRYQFRLAGGLFAGMIDDLLKRDDIGVDLAQNFRDPIGPISPIESDAFMNVVCCDPNSRH